MRLRLIIGEKSECERDSHAMVRKRKKEMDTPRVCLLTESEVLFVCDDEYMKNEQIHANRNI